MIQVREKRTTKIPTSELNSIKVKRKVGIQNVHGSIFPII